MTALLVLQIIVIMNNVYQVSVLFGPLYMFMFIATCFLACPWSVKSRYHVICYSGIVLLISNIHRAHRAESLGMRLIEYIK